MAKRNLGVAASLPAHAVDKGYVDGLIHGAVPVNYGQKAWTFDPAFIQAGNVAVGGTLHLAKILNRAAITVSQVTLSIFTAGATLTNVGVGLWSSAGALLTSSVNVNGATAALWQAVGVKVITFAAPQVIAADAGFYVGWWTTGTTQPALCRSAGSSSLANAGLVSPNLRFAAANGALTNVAPAALAAQAPTAAYWVAAA